MRRVISFLLAAALLLGLLSACQEPALTSSLSESSAAVSNQVDQTAAELASLALEYSGWKDHGGLENVSAEMDREWMGAYIENAYGIQETWLDAAVIRATGASAFEIAVLKMESSDGAVYAATAFSTYLLTRQGDFAGYAPSEADMVAGASFMQSGPYAALFICPDPEEARRAVEASLNREPLDNMDTKPVYTNKILTDVKELRDYLVHCCGLDETELAEYDNPEHLVDYIREAYGLEPEQWDECSIALDIEGSAFEIAVFRFADVEKEAAAPVEIYPDENGVYEVPIAGGSDEIWERMGTVERVLNDYLDTREAQFDSSSEQAKMLHQAVTIQANPYIVLLACPDWENAAQAFADISGSGGYGWSSRYRYLNTDPNYPNRCAFTQPNEDDMSLYDTSAICDAWKEKDPSELSAYDRKIYDEAQKVLKIIIKSGMSDYEKEVAIYSWVVQNVDYDWTHQDRMKETPRESFTPYGGLVNHTAVCLGYATTFQLLCDLTGVECITVPGAAFSSGEDHGWNMVRINGEWYCLDVTWDANMRELTGYGQQENWGYFNVTSDYMADTDHQWDYANTPEATAMDQG